ncbi:hypothetical protein BH09BAC1_BH09BAC1_25550 [soil metagenome]
MPPRKDKSLRFYELVYYGALFRSATKVGKNRLFLLVCLLAMQGTLFAQNDSVPVEQLKSLSLEDLMNIEVTSVSKTTQNLTEVASAIQVITGEAIRRSGASRLPDVMRLVPNLQVARVNSYDWAITSRGFNGASIGSATLSNKLLVMIDGRAVYNALFGGVFWDVQNVLLEDIDRVEVVSGPGGTLWGANAVNGVINVMSKSTKETQGFYATGSVGSFLQDRGAIRYGGHVGEKLFFKVYGQFLDMKSTTYNDTSRNNDRWNMTQGGFRMDYYASEKNKLTVQGDLYLGRLGKPTAVQLAGQNILARWTHTFSEKSDLSVQIYFDRTYRRFTSNRLIDELETYDFDLNHRFKLGKRQTIVWGGGYRFMLDKVNRGTVNAFFTPINYLHLVTGFIQDQITLVPNKLELTIGTKLLSNYYSGFEYQPSARMAYTPSKKHTLWAAVSRAIRGPSRFDVELSPVTEFKSENVVAYELGYRVEPVKKVSLSFAGFYNHYTDVRSLNRHPPAPPQSVFGNNQEVHSWGVEVFAHIWITDWWRIRTGYTYFDKKFFATDTALVAPGSDAFEGNDPNHQVFLQSILNLGDRFEIDVVSRVVGQLPSSIYTQNKVVPAYGSLDIRLAYKYNRWEFSVVGQDLLSRKHREFQLIEIPWSIYGKIVVRI